MKRSFLFILICLLSTRAVWAQAPVPNFTADKTTGCFPIVVKFQDLTTGSPTAWEWDLGNGTISTLQNPAATYLEPGKYKITLKATNASGFATVVKDSFIMVYDKPKTDFQVSSQTGCTPAAIQFTDVTVPQPGNSIVAWKWDFGESSFTSTEQNPTYVYKNAGSYTITLTVTNDKGCSDLKTVPNYIDIVKGVVPKFSNTRQTVCKPPVSINFTNTSTGPETLSYFWDFGNGQTSTEKNPAIVYDAVGAYPVKLVVQSSLGCVDSIRVSNAVPISEIVTKFNVKDICPNTEVLFADSSSAFTISNQWRFSDGQTDNQPTTYKTFQTPGTYSVTLINNYSTCTDSLTKTFNVTPTPSVDFSAALTAGCQPPFPVTFTNNTPDAATYQWDFGDNTTGSTDPNPVHNYTDYGTYNVTMTAITANGCTATATKAAIVNIQKPIVRFKNGLERGCIPYTVTFNESVESNDPVVGYKWDFGDGNSSTERNPTYTYITKGSYKVTLTVTTQGGCTESYSVEDEVKVGTKPVASFTFTPDNVCANQAVQFTDASTDADQWKWDFADGTNSNEKNPLHEFSDFGGLKVQLIAYNSGCPDTTEQVVNVKAPIAAFAFTPNCDNRREVTLTNQSATGAIPESGLTWLWNFGDNTTSTLKNPGKHTFPAFGTYGVTLTVTGDNGCSSTKTVSIITQERQPDFAVNVPTNGGCTPLQVSFSPGTNSADYYKTFIWDFGDNQAATTSGTASHVYTKPGLYDVSVTAIDINGCQDFSTKKGAINVHGPVADFTSLNNTGCKGLTVTFDDKTKTDGQNPIVNWQFDFGDRTSQSFTAPPFQHSYSEVARYGVKLVVTDAAGCKDSISYPSFVKTSDFDMDWSGTRNSCPGAAIRDSSFANLRNYDSFWEFGDGGTSTDPVPRYAYKDTGTYTVKLVITDELGCKDSVIKQNYIRIYRPVASFDANNLITYCTPFEAHFTNNSTYYSSSSWNLGIGTSTQTNPVSYYKNVGTYNIKLTVTSPGGCKDDTTQVLHVFDAKDGKLTYGPLDFSCRPLIVNFNAFSDMKGNFVWDFGDGTVVENDTNAVTHTYDNVGDFIPKIILKEPSGCLVPITGKAPVQVAGANIKFGIDKGFFCDSGLVTIFDSTVVHGRNISYNWDFGDGTSSNVPNPGSHYYSKPGTFHMKLTVKTATQGCIDSLSIKPDIRVSMTPGIHISGDSIICVNQYLQSGGVFDKRDSSFIRWTWQFPNGNTSAVQLPPDQQFTSAGTFPITAIATNSEGCADTSLKNVLVHPLPTAELPSTVTIQAGFPVTIDGTYSPNVVKYTWRPATGLSCTDCPDPIASPKFNTKYIVQYVDSNGCVNSNTVQVVVICKNANVFIPNTFSPNGDGSNDVFYVRGRGLDRVKSLRVFNRWGEVVFEKRDFAVNDASVGWDGKYKGAKPKPDVYVYQVEVFCENGDIIHFDGNVALIQ